MKATLNIRVVAAAALVVAAGLLGACSGHVEIGKTAGVDKDKLAKVVKQKLEAQAGSKADSVVCDDDLPAKVGATQRCVLTVGDTKYGVTVTANSVEDGNVKFGAKVDDEPME
ncbi:hypothetical protein A5740_10470 [Mycobacterium sp. GA-1841]|uniref:DUF4333 domain-containing protein n=1 Tax=Mycobacterium sp. GA-1841 TaxID=1834154 RepID=UPI00096F1E02|nr:DUF4333 domain-containing protein [Mycobacterium sp. GA-1841]OMC34061.1 hypothetical protein A5740_10470 [Mycobacterium sp. GA-1841]